MNITKELEILRNEVIAINGADSKRKARMHIDAMLKELKKEIEIPKWMTVDAENIGANR